MFMRSVLLMVSVVVLSTSCDILGSAGYKQELALFATPPRTAKLDVPIEDAAGNMHPGTSIYRVEEAFCQRWLEHHPSAVHLRESGYTEARFFGATLDYNFPDVFTDTRTGLGYARGQLPSLSLRIYKFFNEYRIPMGGNFSSSSQALQPVTDKNPKIIPASRRPIEILATDWNSKYARGHYEGSNYVWPDNGDTALSILDDLDNTPGDSWNKIYFWTFANNDGTFNLQRSCLLGTSKGIEDVGSGAFYQATENIADESIASIGGGGRMCGKNFYKVLCIAR